MKQFSVVKISSLKKTFNFSESSFGSRAPVVGDIACILDIYDADFELECSDENGVTVWLEIFKPEDAELELVCL
jgi:hypothetical protein